jgi:oligopeptidase A
MTNPLIKQGELLNWPAIRTEDITPALDTLLKEAGEAVTRVTAPETPALWEAVVEPLEATLEKLGRAWSAVGHLTGVMDSEALRTVYNENLPRMTQFYIELSQNEALFAKYKAIEASGAFATLDTGRRRILARELRDFRLSGADLAPEPKARLKELGQEDAALSQKFSENLLDATNAFALDIEGKAELKGIPEDVVAMYRQNAQAAGLEKGWRITLQMPSYLPAMQYADNAALREKLHRAYSTRASEFGPEEKDNTPVIRALLKNRREEALLLGYKNYAEVSLVPKMAESPQAVEAFLTELADKARAKGKADWDEVLAFAKDKLGLAEVHPWDAAWVSESLRRAKYAYSDNEVKQYFTLEAVFNGLYRLVEKLFDVKIEADSAPVWHPDVRLWKITSPDGRLIARFYTDLYARASKRGGAWMDSDTTYCIEPDGTVRTPVAYLVCNFSQPVGGKPALLTHDDVTTLFHEFGHGLHHMLSRVPQAQLSGINGVEWDAVEMPSQFMENWTWNYETLKTLSSHVETGEPLPRELFDKMLAAKNFQSGMFCLRQLEFALFDLRIHDDDATDHAGDFEKVLDDVRKEVAVVPAAEYSRFAQSFGHIFAGGYSAGYYSYKWAEVLSADAFSAFEEEGLFNPETGRRWVDEVLSRGSSRDAIDNFRAFRGRDPSIEPLLRHSGILQ